MRYVCQGQSKDDGLLLSFVALNHAQLAGVGVTTEVAPMAHLQSLLGELLAFKPLSVADRVLHLRLAIMCCRLACC